MYSIKGDNPTQLYYQAMLDVMENGDEVAPRGKSVRELRPASVEFTNPYNRITFLGGRRVNPFFMIAESLWILSGRADVPWLVQYNANMASFSDDGEWFNAPYGERIRAYGQNHAHGIIINPIDQLFDAYTKLFNDKDTRQAVIIISAPMFDNARYTIQEKGKDIACNLVITFKIRHDKLNMTVFNRSNDVHWGLWGANLCQFTTIQETMLTWLKNSGDDRFADLEMGEYCQVTDSLHIYLDDYGAQVTKDVMGYYQENPSTFDWDFTCVDEPRMAMNMGQFEDFLANYWSGLDSFLSDDLNVGNLDTRTEFLKFLGEWHEGKDETGPLPSKLDDYWYFGIQAMLVYRLVKTNHLVEALELMATLQNCQWKISMLNFLKTFIRKADEAVKSSCMNLYAQCCESVRASLIDSKSIKALDKYLEL